MHLYKIISTPHIESIFKKININSFFKNNPIAAIIRSDSDIFIQQILNEKQYSNEMDSNVIYLGNCIKGSFLLSNFLGYVEAYDFLHDSISLTSLPDKKNQMVVIKIDQSTDYNEVERLNQILQDISHLESSVSYKFIFVIDDAEYKSNRMPSSFFTRVMKFQQNSLWQKKDSASTKIDSDVPITKKIIEIKKDIVDLLHEPIFDQKLQKIKFSPIFQTIVDEAIQKSTFINGDSKIEPIEICLCVSKQMDEYNDILLSLNSGGSLDLYNIRFESRNKVVFSIRVNSLDMESRLQTRNKHNQLKPIRKWINDNDLDSPDLVELNDINAGHILSGKPYLKVADNLKYYFTSNTSIKSIYIATYLSDETIIDLLTWLEADQNRVCYLNDFNCIDKNGTIFVNSPNWPVNVDSSISTCTLNEMFKNSSKPLHQYNCYCTPTTVIEDSLYRTRFNFLVSDISDVIELREHINVNKNTHFYLTNEVFQALVQMGPLLSKKNVTLILKDKEIENYVTKKMPSFKRFLSDTTILRLSFLRANGLSIDQAIYFGMIRGIPPENKSKTLNFPLSIDSFPKLLKTYSYSEKGIENNMSLENYDALESLPKLLTLSESRSIFCSTPINGDDFSQIKDALNAGGYDCMPVWVTNDYFEIQKQNESNVETYFIGLYNKFENQLIIGNQQEKMIRAIAKDVTSIRLRDKDESQLIINSRVFIGKSGVGKDEICKYLPIIDNNIELLCKETLDPLDINKYKKIIDSYTSHSKIGILNIQEFNLSDDHIEVFESLVLYALAKKNIYILATANSYSMRKSISPELLSMINRTEVDSLSNQDIKKAINKFIELPQNPHDEGDIETGKNYLKIKSLKHNILSNALDYKFRERINFRLLSYVCEFGLNNSNKPEVYIQFLEQLFDKSLDSEKTKMLVSSEINQKLYLTKRELSLSILVGLISILLQIYIFPWIIEKWGSRLIDVTPDLLRNSIPTLPWPDDSQTLESNPFPELNRKDFAFSKTFKCNFTVERDPILIGIQEGSILNEDSFLGTHIGYLDDSYWDSLFTSNYGRNYLYWDPTSKKLYEAQRETLDIKPFYLSADRSLKLKNMLGENVYRVLSTKIKSQKTLSEKIDVIIDFYHTYFSYMFLPLTMHPSYLAEDAWMDHMKKYGGGVCAHFSRLAMRILGDMSPGEKIASVKTLACNSDMLHEQLLVNENGEIKLKEVTIGRRGNRLYTENSNTQSKIDGAQKTNGPEKNTDSLSLCEYIIAISFILFCSPALALTLVSHFYSVELGQKVKFLIWPKAKKFALEDGDWLRSLMAILVSMELYVLICTSIAEANKTMKRNQNKKFDFLLPILNRKIGPLIPHKKGFKNWAEWTLLSSCKESILFTKENPLSLEIMKKNNISLDDLTYYFMKLGVLPNFHIDLDVRNLILESFSSSKGKKIHAEFNDENLWNNEIGISECLISNLEHKTHSRHSISELWKKVFRAQDNKIFNFALNSSFGSSPYHYREDILKIAAEHANFEQFQVVVDNCQKSDFSSVDYRGMNTLLFLVSFSERDTYRKLEYFLNQEPTLLIESTDLFGENPFHKLSCRKYDDKEKLAELLISKCSGKIINQHSKSGYSPLDLAYAHLSIETTGSFGLYYKYILHGAKITFNSSVFSLKNQFDAVYSLGSHVLNGSDAKTATLE
jgi:hypothetical protein